MLHSLRFKLTLLYVLTVAILLAVFIGADMVGLRNNLMQQAAEHSLSAQAMEETWMRAISEHVLLGIGLVIVVFIFGYAFIRRAFKPVREMIKTARSITEEDLSLRVDAAGDRAELGELANTLNNMIARLEASINRAKRFSADAAHELSTPLTVLRGEIEVTLRRDREKEDYKETLGKLFDQVERLSSTVDNLLFLSRADARRLPEKKETVRLDDLLVMTVENLQALAHDRDITLKLGTIDTSRLSGDAQLLRRMLDNLMGNALKFTPGGGEVYLKNNVDDETFELSIADTGIGIPKPELAHIFDRFYRVEKSRAKATGGAGLGLAIVREIADAHGIDIRIDSEVGKGTTVTLTGACKS